MKPENQLLISPSLITLDLTNLEDQVRKLEANHIPMIHVDILDGHFSPSMPLGLDTVRQLREKTDLPFDCHVMVDDPDFFIDELIDIGVDQIVFQIESASHVDGMLNKIHAAGIKAGVALKPATPLTELEYILDKCDTVLLMLINPGYASVKGEAQVPYSDRKIRDLRAMIDERGLDTMIELDGRISVENMRTYREVVETYVCGSTCLDRKNLDETLRRLNEQRDDILGKRNEKAA